MHSLSFFEKVTILNYGFSLDVEILWFFMKHLNEKRYLIMISLIFDQQNEWESVADNFELIFHLSFCRAGFTESYVSVRIWDLETLPGARLFSNVGREKEYLIQRQHLPISATHLVPLTGHSPRVIPLLLTLRGIVLYWFFFWKGIANSRLLHFIICVVHF